MLRGSFHLPGSYSIPGSCQAVHSHSQAASPPRLFHARLSLPTPSPKAPAKLSTHTPRPLPPLRLFHPWAIVLSQTHVPRLPPLTGSCPPARQLHPPRPLHPSSSLPRAIFMPLPGPCQAVSSHSQAPAFVPLPGSFLQSPPYSCPSQYRSLLRPGYYILPDSCLFPGSYPPPCLCPFPGSCPITGSCTLPTRVMSPPGLLFLPDPCRDVPSHSQIHVPSQALASQAVENGVCSDKVV